MLITDHIEVLPCQFISQSIYFTNVLNFSEIIVMSAIFTAPSPFKSYLLLYLISPITVLKERDIHIASIIFIAPSLFTSKTLSDKVGAGVLIAVGVLIAEEIAVLVGILVEALVGVLAGVLVWVFDGDEVVCVFVVSLSAYAELLNVINLLKPAVVNKLKLMLMLKLLLIILHAFYR